MNVHIIYAGRWVNLHTFEPPDGSIINIAFPGVSFRPSIEDNKMIMSEKCTTMLSNVCY